MDLHDKIADVDFAVCNIMGIKLWQQEVTEEEYYEVC